MLPGPTMRPHLRALALAIVPLALLAALPARGQRFDTQKDRVQMAVLDGLWRFNTGDDPHWADPGFDDSSWALLRSGEGWSTQGYKSFGGLAWYRFQVVLPEHHPQLGFYTPGILTSYQVFANGRLIGQYGGLPPHARADYGDIDQVFPIPPEALVAGKPLQIAIRVWHWPHWAMFKPGGPSGQSRIGDFDLLKDWKSNQTNSNYWAKSANNFLLLIYLLAGLSAMALFALHPADREYLWFGLYLLANAAGSGIEDYRAFFAHSIKTGEFLDSALFTTAYLLYLAFLFVLLRQRKGLLYWLAIASVLTSSLLCLPGALEWISLSLWNALLGVGLLPYAVIVVVLLARAARKGNRDAGLLLIPIGLEYLAGLLELCAWIYESAGHPGFQAQHFAWVSKLSDWPFPYSVDNVLAGLEQLAVLTILVLRFARTRRDEARRAEELEAARAVQHVLIPEEVPAVPGFAIHTVYKPAGQVGGDFFQIVPLGKGGVLVAIGDVSGKGMPAAMTVSLLVGTLRTLVETTTSPAEILSGLNRRLLGRSGGGFTTCMVLRADADGKVTLANAGHPGPYRDGKEPAIEATLPLGLDAHPIYAETSFRLGRDEQLTLLTDGVLEARGKSGELFGFERAQSISKASAEFIAQSAQNFGQDDDITVVTIARFDEQGELFSQSPPMGLSSAKLIDA